MPHDFESGSESSDPRPVALITGSGRRIGAALAQRLHQAGFNLVLHYRHSRSAAFTLGASLEQQRPGSVYILQADLAHPDEVQLLARQAYACFQRMDVLINNASSFYPTPLGTIEENHWDELMDSNLKAPLFLAQALTRALRETRGCIINLVDIHGFNPLPQHSVYSIAKAGLIMLTEALALELAPDIRVNAIAPGAIFWPENNGFSEKERNRRVAEIPQQRTGTTDDIADAALYLIQQAHYVTGNIIKVDGGRSLAMSGVQG